MNFPLKINNTKRKWKQTADFDLQNKCKQTADLISKCEQTAEISKQWHKQIAGKNSNETFLWFSDTVLIIATLWKGKSWHGLLLSCYLGVPF